MRDGNAYASSSKAPELKDDKYATDKQDEKYFIFEAETKFARAATSMAAWGNADQLLDKSLELDASAGGEPKPVAVPSLSATVLPSAGGESLAFICETINTLGQGVGGYAVSANGKRVFDGASAQGGTTVVPLASPEVMRRVLADELRYSPESSSASQSSGKKLEANVGNGIMGLTNDIRLGASAVVAPVQRATDAGWALGVVPTVTNLEYRPEATANYQIIINKFISKPLKLHFFSTNFIGKNTIKTIVVSDLHGGT